MTTFLNSELDDEVYYKIPQGYELSSDIKGKVLQLKRTLYSLKQAPLYWLLEIRSVLIDNRFVQSDADSCLFIRGNVWILVYVDDFLVIAPTLKAVTEAKKLLARYFKIEDLGEAAYFLGIKITRNREKL